MLDELIKFAKQNYKIYADVPDNVLRLLFETYKETTLVYRENGEIRGFAIYQEWPDLLNFFLICGDGSPWESLRVMSAGLNNLPDKKICFFDETKMELRELCRS